MACLDPFTFDTSGEESLLVVDGFLVPGGGSQQLKLSRTLDFGQKFFNPETGAEIILHSGDLSESYGEQEEGIYVLPGDVVKGIPGELYHITIELKDGSKYASSPLEMPALQIADSAFHRFEKELLFLPTGRTRESNVINVYVDTPIDRDNGDVYMRWFSDELFTFPEESCGGLQQPVTCYTTIPGKAQSLILLDAQISDQSVLKNIKVATKTSFPRVEFKGIHIFSIYQSSITKASFEYWTKVQSVALQAGTVFDPPPARIPGNISNLDDPTEPVLGFFDVIAIDTARTIIRPHEFRANIDPIRYCNQFARFRWPKECCNCRSIPETTTIRPPWLK